MEKFKQNNKGEDKRSCYYNPKLIRNPNIKKKLQHVLNKKT